MRILVPVSDYSFGFLIANFIAQHNWPKDAEFRVVNVIEPFVLGRSSQAPLHVLFDRPAEETISASKKLVQAVAASIEKSVSEASVTVDVVEGPTNDALLALTEQWGADLIIAGSHGRKGWSRVVLGSTSLTLAVESSCDVLLVKPSQATIDLWEAGLTEAYENRKSQKILVAVDDLSCANELIAILENHKWPAASEFELINVLETSGNLSFVSAQDLSEMSRDAIHERRTHLKKLAADLREHFKAMTIEDLLVEGDPKTKIVQVAHTWGADLIVVGDKCNSSGRKRLGSVALSVICEAHCSVLLARYAREEYKTEPTSKRKLAAI